MCCLGLLLGAGSWWWWVNSRPARSNQGRTWVKCKLLHLLLCGRVKQHITAQQACSCVWLVCLLASPQPQVSVQITLGWGVAVQVMMSWGRCLSGL